jgi:hypothetical protein
MGIGLALGVVGCAAWSIAASANRREVETVNRVSGRCERGTQANHF